MANVQASFLGKTRSAMEQLIQAITKEIDNRELTMSEAAEMAGVTRAYFYRILKGQNTPSLILAEQIANAFGLTIQVTAKKKS